MDSRAVTNQNPVDRSQDNDLFKVPIMTTFNTNIADYTIDDLFSLLDVNVNSETDYEDIVNDINSKIDVYVETFHKINNNELVTFFEDVRKSLVGDNKQHDNITEGQKLLQIYTARDKAISKDKIGDVLSVSGSDEVKRDNVTKLLTVDSRFRNNYNSSSSTDFLINLPYVINNVTEIRLSDIEFPATFYPFQDSYENNYFWMKYDYTLANIERTKYCYFYVPPGNYYQENLIELLQGFIDIEGAPITISHNLDFNNTGGVGNGDGTVSVAYTGASDTEIITNIELNFKGSKLPDTEQKYNTTHFIDSLTGTDTDIAKIEKYYNVDSTVDYKTRMGWMLGFRYDYYSTDTTYTSEGQLEIIGPRYIYIVLDDFNVSSNVNFFTNNEQSILDGSIIGRISIKAYAFSIQSQNDFNVYSEPRYYFGPVNIDKLQVKVVDEYNRTIDLNWMDFSFTLQMTVRHDVSQTT